MGSSTSKQRNGIDTRAEAARPARSFAKAHLLWVNNAAGDEMYAYLYFNRAFPRGATIMSATLRLYARDSWGTTPTVTLHRISESWKVKRLTWNNRPTVSGSGVAKTQSSAADGDEWAFNLDAMLQNVADTGGWFGVRITTTATTPKAFYSSNAAVEYRPVLEVTWSRAPQAPVDLSPSGDRATSSGKPILRCDFTDHLGSTQMQAIQVQIDPAGNWASPGFDSGTVAATEPELDLTTTAYAGLAALSSTRWRVRVQDGAGLWSPWSDPAWFHRDVKGTLNINNPAGSPNDFVSEWTPPITWNLSGETQKAWQVFVTPDDDRSDVLHDTGRVKGTDTSHTLPPGVIEDDSRYRVFVRVWDTKDREHTPGDPPYTPAEQSFDFREDPTPNPVTTLAAVNLFPRAHVELTWDRSTAPDRFVVKRDGKVIETDLEPDDVNVGDIHYRWVDKEARPYRNHTYVVQAVANAKTSASNPSVSIKPETAGVWLTDRERDIDVLIAAGRDPAGQIVMGEDGTTHYPLGADQGIRITQGVRGWEGSVTGELLDYAGLTANEWQDRLLKLKEHPGDDLTLTLGHEAFRVVAFNIVTTPLGARPGTKTASFEFIQIGRLSFRPRL